MPSSSFADRLWWARHKAGLGATKLARLVGCAQSLISSLERTNAEKSKLNNKFAQALHVDPTWLAKGGADRAPPDFDADTARRGREKGKASPSVRLPPIQQPQWAADVEPLAPLTGADARMKGLIADFMDFVHLAGPTRAVALLTTLRHVLDLMSAEEPSGQRAAGEWPAVPARRAKVS